MRFGDKIGQEGHANENATRPRVISSGNRPPPRRGAAVSGSGEGGRPKVGVFVTCLVNLLRPSVADALVRLVEDAGGEPVVPASQTCCGQPAYNSGHRKLAVRIAAKLAHDFEGCGKVVVPSGSCAGMVSRHFPDLAPDAGADGDRLLAAAGKFVELSRFLEEAGHRFDSEDGLGKVTYHDCCAGLRELGVKSAPRRMLEQRGYEIVEMAEPETCCGFGGTFSVKYPEISAALADAKCEGALATDAPAVVMGDLGCMLHLEGRLARTNPGGIRFLHLAEALAPR